MWVRAAAKYVFGLVLAVALLAWVLHGASPGAVWETLEHASPWGLLLAVLLNIGHNAFRVWRWRALLEPVRPRIPFRPMFDAVILGYMTSWVVPGRVGELVRPALLAGREGLPVGACLGSVLADRLLDGVTVLVLLALGLALAPLGAEAALHTRWIELSAFLVVGLIAVPLLVLMVASSARGRIERALADRRGASAWIGRAALSLSRGVEALRRPGLLLRVALHSLLAWLMIAGGTWVAVRACGASISFGGTLVLLPLLVLGIALPTPGGAGGYHAAMKFGLVQLFSVSEPVAVATGFVVHALVVVPVILLGALLLVVDRIPFRDLLAAARQVRPAERLP
jgi:uncharacterized protein (TIRG00374 family)